MKAYEWRDFPTNGTSEGYAYSVALHGHSSQLVGHQIFVFGGYDAGAGEVSNRWHVLDLCSKTWSILAVANPPSPRFFHNMLLVEDKLYVYGGEELFDMYEVDVITLQCREVKPQMITSDDVWLKEERMSRFGQSLVYYERRDAFVLFGGCLTAALQLFKVDTRKWSAVDTKGRSPHVRHFQSSCMSGDHLFIAGGTAAEEFYFNDFFMFTFSNYMAGIWTTLSPHQESVHGFAYTPMVLYKGCLLIFGGGISTHEDTAGLQSFNLAQMWLRKGEDIEHLTLGDFSARACHSAHLLTGSKRLIVLGGMVASETRQSPALKDCAEILLKSY